MKKPMLDKALHTITLVNILKDISADSTLSHALGFKGGTCAYLLYSLPRFSVDLDFDLLSSTDKQVVMSRMTEILLHYGKLEESIEKRNTLFFLLTYEKGEKKIKIEISKRPTLASFEIRRYLGIPLLVMKKESLFASKLAALLLRTHLASRDLFDLWFFFSNKWGIDTEVLKHITGFTLHQALNAAIKKVKIIPKNQLLHGLGELIDEKQKTWVKEKLKDELILFLQLYKKVV